ncbi:MAG: aminoacyl-tRNA hydrolase [Lentisphaerae bacterium]|nr:aminoacyl-tRNA hydrolase [Lentisphaerota bacterium]
MKLVVGLGNPGRRYAGTPHNVGFMTVDRLAEGWGCRMRRSIRFSGRLGRAATGAGPVGVFKPGTYMNRSGTAVAAVMRYYRVAREALLVVSDDADLELGQLRVRPRGGSGGHRGLASVIEHVGGEGFTRVRVGIGRGSGERDLVAHVLSSGSEEDRKRLEAMAAEAAEAVRCVLESGVEAAMNRFNGRRY